MIRVSFIVKISLLGLALLWSVLAVGPRFFPTWSWPETGLFVSAPEIIVSRPDFVPPPRATVMFVGDIMLGRGVAQAVEKKGGDFSSLLSAVAPVLQAADAVIGNLEGPIAATGTPVGGTYAFRMATSTARLLRQHNFQALTVANNHAGDWGRAAFLETLDYLAAARILSVGGGREKEQAIKPALLTLNSLRFGLLAFSDVGPAWLAVASSSPGILLARDPERLDYIRQAAREVDVLIVSYHFGEEYQSLPTDRQRSLAHSTIDAGAKVVLGHHPHVTQALERYGAGLIMYSLGNFIFDQSFSQATMSGAGVAVSFRGGDIMAIEYFPTTLNQDYQVSFLGEDN